MATVKVLKDPGFLYDLNYIFYSRFNPLLCIEELEDPFKRDDYAKHLQETAKCFGDISEELYVFFHAIENGRCFITSYYLDPYKEEFVSGFNFKKFKELISNTSLLMQNIIRFYMHYLPKRNWKNVSPLTPNCLPTSRNPDIQPRKKASCMNFFTPRPNTSKSFSTNWSKRNFCSLPTIKKTTTKFSKPTTPIPLKQFAKM